jgi:hypothetical protein
MDIPDEEQEYSVRAGVDRDQQEGGENSDEEEITSEDISHKLSPTWREPEAAIAEDMPSLEGK